MLSENLQQRCPSSGFRPERFDGFCDKMTTAPPLLNGGALNTDRQTGPTLAVKPEDTQSSQPTPTPLTIPAFRRPFADGFHRPLRRHGIKRSKMKKAAKCVVCGERASGMYFGALVCLPCKSFFIRCTKDGKPQLTCLGDKNCSIDRSNRMRCQYCRYQKCLNAGMMRREKPETVEPGEGQELCKVCADIANGIHFGVMTCEGCKKFFRRALKEADTYDCKHEKICTLNPRNRNACRYCRYRKCVSVGMSRQAIRMGRPKKVKAENEAQYDGYGGYDHYYPQTPAVVPPYGTMVHPPHGQYPPGLTMPQISPPQSSRYPLSSSSDDSGIESDVASSPPAIAHSPPLSGTTIKSEPQDCFTSCSGNFCYPESKNDCQKRPIVAATSKDVDVKNGVVDLEDFFLHEPMDLDTEDMNDVLTTLGQFLGSMGQPASMNSNSTNGCNGFNGSIPPHGVLSDRPLSVCPQQSNLLPGFSKTYQGTFHMQESFQQGFTPDTVPYGYYKQWQSSQQYSLPYFCDQSNISQRQGVFPCSSC